MSPERWCVALKDLDSFVVVYTVKIAKNMYMMFDRDNRPIKKFKRTDLINLAKEFL